MYLNVLHYCYFLPFVLPPFLSEETKSHKAHLVFLDSHVYFWLLAWWGEKCDTALSRVTYEAPRVCSLVGVLVLCERPEEKRKHEHCSGSLRPGVFRLVCWYKSPPASESATFLSFPASGFIPGNHWRRAEPRRDLQRHKRSLVGIVKPAPRCQAKQSALCLVLGLTWACAARGLWVSQVVTPGDFNHLSLLEQLNEAGVLNLRGKLLT